MCIISENEEEGVSELLQNVKLKSETELWELLTGEEQKAFLKGIETGYYRISTG